MDPVSAIGLVASIVQLIATTSKVIKYVDEVKDAPKERASLASEAANLMPLLITLKQRAETSASTDPWFSSVKSLGVPGGPLTELQVSMEQLGGKLKSRRKKLSGHLLWPSDQKECLALLAKIERVKSLIGLAMQDDHFKLSITMKKDINKVSNEITTTSEGVAELQVRDSLNSDLEILDWLSPQTFGGRQNDIFSMRATGTGAWLPKRAEFQAFLSQGQRALWCHGMPGAGKTVLTSYMVDHLKRTYTNANVGIAFVYCNYKDPDQTPENLIASLLRQFAQRLPSLPEEIRNMYKQHNKDKTRPSLADYLHVLHIVARMFSQAFLLVDALDECKEQDGARKRFLAALKELSLGIRIVVTSRRVPAIGCEFSEALKLEIHADSKDVAEYVRSRIATAPRLMRHLEADPMLESMISGKIVDNCHGMFLMAKLHMDSLTKQPHRKALRLALENLPPELNETYNEALARIDGQDKEDTKIAHQVLGWITHATQPLTMKQLQHALSIEPEQADLEEETLIDEELLISTCLGLVTVDHTSEEVRLVHYTAQKYFEHRLLELIPDSHMRIASTCLTYMSFKTCQEINSLTSDEEIKALGDRYPLLDYAGSNWGIHAQRDDQKLVQQILRFLSPKATYLSSRLMIGGFKSLIQETSHTHWDYPVMYEARVSGHNMAAYFGLQHTLMTLLSEASGIKDMTRSTLLICSARGHQILVQLLLDRGANINTCSWLGWTPLHLASAKGSLAMTKFLLGGNADVNKRHSPSSSTALQRAAENGYTDILQTLLEHGANVNIMRHDTDHASEFTALRSAVLMKDVASVNVLLDGGADVNALHLNSHWLFNTEETKLYKFRTTVLFDAVYQQQEAIVKLLIDKGADVDMGDVTPLFRAVSAGNGRVVSLLLNSGAKINALHLKSHWLFNAEETKLYEFRTTVLFDAVYQQQEAIVKLLLDKGADVDMGDVTPLFRAVSAGNGRMVSLLIKNGADLRIPEALKDLLEEGLWYSSYRMAFSEESLSQKFLGQALVAVANSLESGSLAETLINSGADINLLSINEHRLDFLQRNGDEWLLQDALKWDGLGGALLDFPLLAAWRSGNEPLVRFLLDRGAKTWGVEKETWFQQAITAKPEAKEPVEGSLPKIRVIYGKIIGRDDFREMLRNNRYSKGLNSIFDRIARQIDESVFLISLQDKLEKI